MDQEHDWDRAWDPDFLDRNWAQYQEMDRSVKFAASAFDAARRLPREEESAATLVASSQPQNATRRQSNSAAFRFLFSRERFRFSASIKANRIDNHTRLIKITNRALV